MPFPPFVEFLPRLDRPGELKMRINPHMGQCRAWDSKKRFIVVLAGSQSGKALDIETEIPTPDGFRRMGDLQVGDLVFGSNGEACRVKYVSPVYENRQCFRVTFDDGSRIVADAEHLWQTSTLRERKAEFRTDRVGIHNSRMNLPQCRRSVFTNGIRTTIQICNHVHWGDSFNHSIALCGQVRFKERSVPLDPYTFGCWLGDGSSGNSNLTCADPEIIEEIKKAGISVGCGRHDKRGNKALRYVLGHTGIKGGNWREARKNKVREALRSMGVEVNKRIPEDYLFGSVEQRLSFLQGLMDTDGWCEKKGRCGFANGREWITAAVKHLVNSLGIKTTERIRETGSGKPSWEVCFYTMLPVFRLSRKRAMQANWKRRPAGQSRCDRRFIVSVEPVPSVPVRCISVDSSNSLYLAGKSFIPTHNTTLGVQWLYREIQDRGPGDYMVVAPSFPLLDKKAIPEFCRIFQDKLKLGKFRGSRSMTFVISPAGQKYLWNHVQDIPTQIFFGYAANPDSLEAATAKAAWLDEAGQKDFKAESWEAVQRRVATTQGRIFITTTLYNFGWLKTMLYNPWNKYRKDKKVHPYIDVIAFDSCENPAFSKEEFERLRAVLPGWKFDMFHRGIYSKPAGIVYDYFSDEKHVVKGFRPAPHWPRYLGLDFGGVNTVGVFVTEDPRTKNLYIYRTYHAGGRTAKEHKEQLMIGEDAKIKLAVGGSGSEQQWRDEFTAAGLKVLAPDIKDRNVGILRVYGQVKQDRLFLAGEHNSLLEEFQTYSWELNEAGEPTDDIENANDYHHLDAVRYIVGYLRRNSQHGSAISGGTRPAVMSPAHQGITQHTSGDLERLPVAGGAKGPDVMKWLTRGLPRYQ